MTTSTAYAPQIPVFKINGVTMPTPSTFQWGFPKPIGITGQGFQRLYPFFEITLIWDYLSFDEYTILYDTFLGSISGTSSAQLPTYYGTAFGTGSRVTTYQSVIIDAPVPNQYIENNFYTNVKMVIRKIAPLRH